jgi:hypothetical protein
MKPAQIEHHPSRTNSTVRQKIDPQLDMIAHIQATPSHVDIDMPIAFEEVLPSGATKITAAGTYEDELIGFGIEFPIEWEIYPGQAGRPSIFRGQIAITSLGLPSDVFVRRLAEAYGVGNKVNGMRDRVIFTATSFHGDPRYLKSSSLSFKIFHKTTDPPVITDAEYFLGIDSELGKVTFHEKDSDYRPQILKAFMA